MRIVRPDGVIIDGQHVFVPARLNDGSLCPIGLRGDQSFVPFEFPEEATCEGMVLEIAELDESQRMALKL